MFNSIKAKLLLFSGIGVTLIVACVMFSYFIMINSVNDVMRTDVTSVSNVLEGCLGYIAQINPEAYKEEGFKKMVYSVKIGKTGTFSLMDSSGTLRIHATEEGANKAGEAFIDHVRTHKEAGIYEYTNFHTKQEKIAAYRYIKAWDMWILPNVNKADYFQLLKDTFLKWVSALAVIAMATILAVGNWIHKTMTKPLRGLLRIFKDMDKNGNTPSDAASSKETRALLCRLLENLL